MMNRSSKKNLLILTLAALTFTASCKKQEDSDTSALTNQNLSCTDYSAAQLAKISAEMNAVPGLFSKFATADNAALVKHFAAIPASYRSELINLKKAGTFQGFVKADLGTSGVMGSCSSTNRGPRLISLTSRYPNAINFAMIHEIGHGVEGIVQRKAGKTNAVWESTLKGLMAEAEAFNKKGGISRAQQVRDYAFHSDAEFFAESFHNYYCSKETHSFIEKNLPKTYAFLKTVLEAPVFASGAGPTPAPTPKPTTPTLPTPNNDDKGEAMALDHVANIVKTYNAKSTKCNLVANSVKMVEADGDFVFDASVLKVDGSTLPAVRLRTNYKLAMNSEMNDLKNIVPKLFPGCPAQ